jgi:hypothetical protein
MLLVIGFGAAEKDIVGWWWEDDDDDDRQKVNLR